MISPEPSYVLSSGGRGGVLLGLNPTRDEELKLIHIASHPIRYAILRELEKGRPLYINELSDRLREKEMHVDRKIIAFHLMTLQDNGLIETYLETKEPPTGNPVVVRYSKLTPNAKEVLAKLSF